LAPTVHARLSGYDPGLSQLANPLAADRAARQVSKDLRTCPATRQARMRGRQAAAAKSQCLHTIEVQAASPGQFRPFNKQLVEDSPEQIPPIVAAVSRHGV
jgi:hypothetical protein